MVVGAHKGMLRLRQGKWLSNSKRHKHKMEGRGPEELMGWKDRRG